MQQFRVGIIGGGPAGVAAAITLGRKGIGVVLFDKSQQGDFKVGECIPPSCTPILSELGLLSIFGPEESSVGTQAEHDRPLYRKSFQNSTSWGASSIQSNEFLMNPYNSHGWHVDRAALDETLREQVAKIPGCKVVKGVASILRDRGKESKWILTTQEDQPSKFELDFLVDATGRRRFVALSQGARLQAIDNLVASVAVFDRFPSSSRLSCKTFQFRLPAKQGDDAGYSFDTLVEATEEGWWYGSSLPQGERLIAYHTDGDSPSLKEARKVDSFSKLLNESTLHVRNLVSPDHRLLHHRVVAANTTRLNCPFGEGWIAVGDAAQCFDPLSSQGILSALKAGVQCGKAVQGGLLGGDKLKLLAYKGYLDLVFDEFLQQRRYFYSLEQRWPDSPFWNKRF